MFGFEPLRALVFVALMPLLGCIEGTRQATEDGGTETGLSPEAEVQGDAGIEVELASDGTDTGGDTEETIANDTSVELDTIALRCLPARCSEPGVDCPLDSRFCWIAGECVDDGAPHPGDDCRFCSPEKAPRTWTSRQDGEACDDGLSCTRNDICRGGLCQGDPDCPSSLSCLTPVCDSELGACRDDVDPGRCLFENACYSAGQALTGLCSRCDPGASQIVPTPGDSHEPDDSLAEPNRLTFNELLVTTGTNLDEAWNGPWTTSTLSPLLDVDVFSFEYASNSGFSRPVFKLDRADSLELEVCVYVRCPTEPGAATPLSTNTTCGGTDIKKTVDGWSGCCRASTALQQEFIPVQAWCERSGTKVNARADAAATIRRIVPPAAPDCHPYTLRWGVR